MEYSGMGLQQEKKLVTVNCFTSARNKKIKIPAGYIAKKNPAAKATGTFKTIIAKYFKNLSPLQNLLQGRGNLQLMLLHPCLS